jgi:ADP-ribose pyrophosphatase YjhB (NUDIX family)
VFTKDSYDRERYRTLQDIAMSMMALATGERLEQLEPLRATIFSRPTPLAVGGAAVIDAKGRILLIRRADNRRWAMPGGALEVGEAPAEGVLREVLEETGVRCRPVALVGIFDSRRCGTPSRHHMYHISFLCEPLPGVEPETPSHRHEVLDSRWFAEDDLPPDLDPGHISRIPVAYRVWHGHPSAFFDPPTVEQDGSTVPSQTAE